MGSKRHTSLDGDGYISQSSEGYINSSESGGLISLFKHWRVRPMAKLPPAESPPTKMNFPEVPNEGKFCNIQLYAKNTSSCALCKKNNHLKKDMALLPRFVLTWDKAPEAPRSNQCWKWGFLGVGPIAVGRSGEIWRFAQWSLHHAYEKRYHWRLAALGKNK